MEGEEGENLTQGTLTKKESLFVQHDKITKNT